MRTIFFILRIILGMGESISYPSYSHILASRFPEHHRGFANAFIDAGSKSGPALGTLLGTGDPYIVGLQFRCYILGMHTNFLREPRPEAPPRSVLENSSCSDADR